MNNDLDMATFAAFKSLEQRPFMTLDMALHQLSLNELSTIAIREMMDRIQDDAYRLGYAKAMGWL